MTTIVDDYTYKSPISLVVTDYNIASLTTLIGRSPDFAHRTNSGVLFASWELGDGRVVSFRMLDGDNSFLVHQKEKAPGVSPEG
jgi:hypothetical protein